MRLKFWNTLFRSRMVRLNSKSSKPIIAGFTAPQLLAKVQDTRSKDQSAPAVSRLFRLGEGKNQRVFVQFIYPYHSDQSILEVFVKHRSKLTFGRVASFSSDFADRTIFDRSLRGIGLGSRALRTFLAVEKSRGIKQVFLDIKKKSTALLFIRNGFRIDVEQSDYAMEKLGLSNEKAAIRYIKSRFTSEDFPSHTPFYFYKKI